MSATGHHHGYKIIWSETRQAWLYTDTGLPTAGTWRERPCGHCSKPPTTEGHDGCLGTLPESVVRNACCGHGNDSEAYIQYWDGTDIRGPAAMSVQARMIRKRDK